MWFLIIEMDAGGILQMFGKMFFEFCQESGYDTILRVLGSNVREFLQVRGYCFYHPKISSSNVEKVMQVTLFSISHTACTVLLVRVIFKINTNNNRVNNSFVGLHNDNGMFCVSADY